MKARAFILASVLLVGCQVSNKDATTAVTGQHDSPSVQRFSDNINLDNVQWASTGWLANNDGIETKDLWNVISDELSMAVPNNSRVEEQRARYLKNKSDLHDVTVQAEPYMYWIVGQVKKRGMPMELVLLPIVESAFNPHATSSASAAGLWQIVPTTGLYYGLRQDTWYDGRRDIAASTTAALDLLQRLNGMFNGDWLLTLAAYNSGEGRVLNAIKQNKAKGKPTDYWSLSLPKETQQYVPKLLALSDLIKNKDQYQVYLPKNDPDRALAQVDVGQQIELSQAAKMAGMQLSHMKTFNAGYKYSVTTPDGPHTLMLPVKNVKRLQESLLNSNIELVRMSEHSVSQGDTVETLAKKYNIPTTAISQANNLVSGSLTPGQTIKLPVPQEYKTASNAASQQKQKTPATNKSVKTHYKVRSGDTVSKIARLHNVSITDVQRWNNLKNTSKLKLGQSIQIVRAVTAGSKLSTKEISYKIRKGDSLTSIAKRHNVNINDLVSWNRSLNDVHSLKPGDSITVHIARK